MLNDVQVALRSLLTAVSMGQDRSGGVVGTIQLYDKAFEYLSGPWLPETPMSLNYALCHPSCTTMVWMKILRNICVGHDVTTILSY